MIGNDQRLCHCGRAGIPQLGFAELLDLLRGQCAVLIRVRFRKTFEYSRQLLFGGLLRLRTGEGRRRQQSEDHEAQDGVLFVHGLRFP